MKRCNTCTYFPCLKVQCSIGNKEGCEDYKSTVASIAKKLLIKEEKTNDVQRKKRKSNKNI